MKMESSPVTRSIRARSGGGSKNFSPTSTTSVIADVLGSFAGPASSDLRNSDPKQPHKVDPVPRVPASVLLPEEFNAGSGGGHFRAHSGIIESVRLSFGAVADLTTVAEDPWSCYVHSYDAKNTKGSPERYGAGLELFEYGHSHKSGGVSRRYAVLKVLTEIILPFTPTANQVTDWLRRTADAATFNNFEDVVEEWIRRLIPKTKDCVAIDEGQGEAPSRGRGRRGQEVLAVVLTVDGCGIWLSQFL
ncbi:hypothetical protein J6590_020814 [Homalodisca vitripennis]|nr:hypothetical protein J6590_020814 [Homalodisca vitripennis]